MTIAKIEAVLFDLGETLLTFGRPRTSALLARAAKSSYEFLRQSNQPVGPFWLYKARSLLNFRWRYLMTRIAGRDFCSMSLFKKYGRKKGFTLTDEQWQQFSWLWYEPLRNLGKVETGLKETLAKLVSDGIKLGIISNTFVHSSSLERHLAQEHILDYFPVRLYSYDFEFAKPHKEIFLAAAKKLHVKPANTLYVGDRIDKDIIGALNAGMLPVLKSAYTNRGKKPPERILKISKISELPALIEKINCNETICGNGWPLEKTTA